MNYSKLVFLSFLISTIGFGQSGPGGVGSFSSNGLWLRADNITQADNTPLATWADFSGNANHANQISTSAQPIYFSTSNLNGMPIVRLDGSNDEMVIADSPLLDGTVGITFYVVIRPNNLDGAPRGILGKRVTFTVPSEYAYTWFFYSGNKLNLDVNTQDNRFSSNTTSFSNANNYILSWDFDGTLPSPQRSRMRTGSSNILRATESTSALTNSNQSLAIGALNVGYGTYLGADYAEVIHFNYALDTVDHILLQNYLSAKYDISITFNDLYNEDDPANGNYDFDVAGIGRTSSTEINNDAQGSGIVRILNPAGLDNNEFLIWGHDNGLQQATEITDIPTGVQARFNRVWRASEVNGSGTSIDVGAIDIRLDLTGLGNITASDLRLLVDSDNDGIFSDETTSSGGIISGAISLGSNIYQFTGVSAITDNSRFTLGTINAFQTPLPIDLINFIATPINNESVKLNWQTASETNNDYFTVERSKDGMNWDLVENKKAAGNSSILLNYSIIDKHPYLGISYYRLKQTDFDGKFKNFKMKRVSLQKSSLEVNIYPNPTNTRLTIKGDPSELKEILVYNVLGQDVTHMVNEVEINLSSKIVDLSRLSKGLYYIKTRTIATKVYNQ